MFPGQWLQGESGLHQNWMRDYDPVTGSYLQPDPLGLVDGPAVYAYAMGAPGVYVDPRGLQVKGRNRRPMEEQGRCSCEVPNPDPIGMSQLLEYFAIAESQPPSPFCLPWFYDQVKNKGPWDYKQRGREYEEYGNWHYGVTGAAAGISNWTLLNGAGYAQTQAGTSQENWGSPIIPFDGGTGDDPQDSEWIRNGIDYYRCGCAN